MTLRSSIGRPLALAALVTVGVTVAPRLPLTERPRGGAAALTLHVSTPGTEPGEVARRWIEPLERRLRRLPEVESIGGELLGGGADLRLDLRAGADAERLAARLDAELAHAADLAGATVSVAAPDHGEERPAIVWLPATAGAATRRLVERLRATPGVGRVDVLGTAAPEIAVELSPRLRLGEPALGAIDAVVASASRRASFGAATVGGRREPVVRIPALPAAASDGELARAVAALPVPLGDHEVALGSLGRVIVRSSPPTGAARRDGAAAIAILVDRDPDAAPLPLDGELRRIVAAVPGAALEWDEPVALRRLLLHLGLGLLAVVALGAAIGAVRGRPRSSLALAAAPLALGAAVVCGWWIADVGLDRVVLVAGWLAIAAALPLVVGTVTRMERSGRTDTGRALGTLAVVALVVPLAAALAPRDLSAFLREPSRAFFVAVVSCAPVLPLLPRAPWPRRRRAGRILRSALRDGGTTLLLAASVAAALAVGWGASLLPRVGGEASSTADVVARFGVPPEATVAETLPRTARVETLLRQLGGVARSEVLVQGTDARVEVRLAPGLRRRDRLRHWLAVARSRIGSGAAVVAPSLEPGGAAEAVLASSLAGETATRPEADVEGSRYRILLRGGDLAALDLAYERVRERLATLKVRDSWVEARSWSAPTARLRLVPAPTASLAATIEATSALARRTAMPRAVRAPGAQERWIRTFLFDTPRTPAALPQAAALLRAPLPSTAGVLVPTALFVTRVERVRTQALRRDGRFVVPIEISVPFASETVRLVTRRRWDAALAELALPAGTELLRPGLGPAALRWHPEQVRLGAFTACLPLLFALLATVRLGGGLRVAATVAAIVVGALAAAPLAAMAGGLGEVSLFAVLAALAGGLGAVSSCGVELPPAGGGDVYRALRMRCDAAPEAIVLAGVALVVPTLGVAADMPWAGPLRIAAVAAIVAMAAGWLLLPTLTAVWRDARRRRSPLLRSRRHPDAWQDATALRLEARSLVKLYPLERSLFARALSPSRDKPPAVRALDRVSFTLEPGIVGLLGPNGAGKTTLLRILTGILGATRGGVRFVGVPVGTDNLSAYRQRVGFLPQGFDAYPGFTAAQFLDYWARERGMSDRRRRDEEIATLLAAVGLAEHADRRVRDFSGGMRQRVGIARALLGAPPVLVVDEPTTGLDLEARRRFRDALVAIAADRIIVFSTHIPSDVDAVAGRILLLYGGRIRFDGPPAELVARARGRVFEALVGDTELAEVGRRFRVTSRVREVAGVRIRAVAPRGAPLGGEAVEPNLEEAYLAELS